MLPSERIRESLGGHAGREPRDQKGNSGKAKEGNTGTRLAPVPGSLQGAEAVVVDWCLGPKLPNVIEPYARSIPLHCAFGKVLLAYQPQRWLDRFLDRTSLPRLTEHTVVSREELVEQIDAIRREGCYVSRCENMEGAGSISAPVRGEGSTILGALFVTAPLPRLSETTVAHHREALLAAAGEIGGAQWGRRAARGESARRPSTGVRPRRPGLQAS
jgi:hypothetical protein